MASHWKDLNIWLNWISHLSYLRLTPLRGESTVYPLSLAYIVRSSTYFPFLPQMIVLHKCFPGNWKFSEFGETANPFKGNNYGACLCSFFQLINISDTYNVSDVIFGAGDTMSKSPPQTSRILTGEGDAKT